MSDNEYRFAVAIIIAIFAVLLGYFVGEGSNQKKEVKKPVKYKTKIIINHGVADTTYIYDFKGL